MVAAVNSSSPEKEKIMDEAKVTPVSFAPQGFVFQPPSGLRTFQPTPLSPRSADAFLSPRYFICKPVTYIVTYFHFGGQLLIFSLAFCSLSFEPQEESTNPISSSSGSSSAHPFNSPPSCMSEPCPESSNSAPSHQPLASSTSPPATLSHPSLPSPPPAPVSARLPPPPTLPPASPSALSEPQHDVPYFR